MGWHRWLPAAGTVGGTGRRWHGNRRGEASWRSFVPVGRRGSALHRAVWFIDLTAVIRQSILYNDTRNQWHLTQLVFLSILLTLTLIRGCFMMKYVEDADASEVEGSAK